MRFPRLLKAGWLAAAVALSASAGAMPEFSFNTADLPEEGRVVLFSTHVVEDVAVACERVLVLAGGELVFDGQPGDLAAVAAGEVWEARVGGDEESTLGADAILVDRVPDDDGGARLRLLSPMAPFPSARPVEPTLEDGYLKLVGGHEEDAP